MRPKAIYYFIIMLLVTGMIACGADDDDPEPAETKDTQQLHLRNPRNQR